MLADGNGGRGGAISNEGAMSLGSFKAVFRIRDLLVWTRMRMRILGSVPLTNGSGWGCDPDPDGDLQ